MDCHRYSLFLGDGRVHQGHLSKRRMIWGKSMHFFSTHLSHTSTFCHRSLFLGDGKVHEGHVGKARLIWGNGCISVPHLFIKVQGCKTYTSTICMVQKFEQTTWKTINLHAAKNLCIKVQLCKTHTSTFYVAFNWCICYPCLLCQQTYTCYFQCMRPDKR